MDDSQLRRSRRLKVAMAPDDGSLDYAAGATTYKKALLQNIPKDGFPSQKNIVATFLREWTCKFLRHTALPFP